MPQVNELSWVFLSFLYLIILVLFYLLCNWPSKLFFKKSCWIQIYTSIVLV